MTTVVQPVIKHARRGRGGRSGLAREIVVRRMSRDWQLAAGHVGWLGAMIGSWGPLSERAPLPAAPLVLVRGVLLPVPGCSGGWGRGPE